MMRTLLIVPPFGGKARGFSLGLGYLAANAEEHGFEIDVLDMMMEEATIDALPDILVAIQPHVVGISVVCATYLKALEVVRASKATLGNEVITLMGGPHSTFAASTILERHPEVDYCVLGEADYTLVELLKELDKHSPSMDSVNGIAFRNHGSVHLTPPRKFIRDLTMLPHPARHLFKMKLYTTTASVFEEGAACNAELITSRGCPYPCEFCSTKEFWSRFYRTRSAEHIVSELGMLVEDGYHDFYFDDDIFTVKRAHVMELCNQIINAGLDINWACGTRVDRVDLDMLLKMKVAGCRYIYFGVESGDEAIIRQQKKLASIADVERAFDLMKEVGIYSSCALIFGLPGETLDTVKRTIDWVRDRLQPNEVYVSKASCYPGTALADYYGVTAEDYEVRTSDGLSAGGMIYAEGGIQTPFFLDEETVDQIWYLVQDGLGHLDLLFGDGWRLEDKLGSKLVYGHGMA